MPINAAVRAVGRGPPSAQVSKASRIGNTLPTNSANATGTRATAEYRHRLWAPINSPSANCQRHAPGGRRKLCRCQSTIAANTSSVPPERSKIASSTPAPSSNAARAATWLPAKAQPMHSRISTARWRGNGAVVAGVTVERVMAGVSKAAAKAKGLGSAIFSYRLSYDCKVFTSWVARTRFAGLCALVHGCGRLARSAHYAHRPALCCTTNLTAVSFTALPFLRKNSCAWPISSSTISSRFFRRGKTSPKPSPPRPLAWIP